MGLKRMPLVRIVSNEDETELIRRGTPNGSGFWGEAEFTAQPVENCDYCVFLNNNIQTDITVNCPSENIWMLVQEPYMAGLTDWVMEKHGAFGRVYTHRPANASSKYHQSQTALRWHVGKTYDQLKAMAVPPEKTKQLSAIIGGARDLPGHRQRFNFVQTLRKSALSLELFGKEVNPIDNKSDALEPYFYSLAIENNSNPDMWTEKLADCFLSWTVPFYYGCTNLNNYFPADSYIQIDIADPAGSIQLIRETLSSPAWESRLNALREARTLILEKYQFFPFIAGEIEKQSEAGFAQKRTIPAYSRSLSARCAHAGYKWARSLRKRITDKRF